MATTNSTRVNDKEMHARAKMAGFIDRVIDIIETTPKRKSKATRNRRSKVTRRAARSAMR